LFRGANNKVFGIETARQREREGDRDTGRERESTHRRTNRHKQRRTVKKSGIGVYTRGSSGARVFFVATTMVHERESGAGHSGGRGATVEERGDGRSIDRSGIRRILVRQETLRTELWLEMVKFKF